MVLRRLHPAVRNLPDTASEHRAHALVQLAKDWPEPMTTAEVAQKTGFSGQAASVALETLAAVGWLRKVYDKSVGMWRWEAHQPSGYTPPDERPSRKDRLFTVAQAAGASGLSEKAIRRRIERGTLISIPADEGPGRRKVRVITHEALLRAGLVDGSVRLTKTGQGIARMVRYLRGRPGEKLTTDELRWDAKVPRQVCELALIVLRAAELVERHFHGGFGQYRWTWIAD